jgi:kynurenine formamidase
MRIKSLVIGYVFALALFLFAQRHPNTAQPVGFHAVVDLTSPRVAASAAGNGEVTGSIRRQKEDVAARQSSETRLDAPATLATGLWTVDQIPPERLIAPLVVLDVSDSVKKNPDYLLSVMDIAKWERTHGEIPPGSVVMARTRATRNDSSSTPSTVMHSAGYSPDAAKFLIEGRSVVSLGIDSRSVDPGLSKDHPVYRYTLSRDVYLLENVADLDRAPAGGGIVMVAPPKLEYGTHAPVRILALAR